MEHHLEIPFKSRYFTFGELGEATKHIWIVCHGYGQLAYYFLKNFERLNPKEHFVIAPEGMNRFYLEGFDGRVGATWMTKEDREQDILNYCTQLNTLYNQLVKPHLNNSQLNLLGFSQGAATISRWMTIEKVNCNNLIIWAGSIAHDIDYSTFLERYSRIFLVVGKNDQFFSEQKVQEYLSKLKHLGIDAQLFQFNGTHSIDGDMLLRLASL